MPLLLLWLWLAGPFWETKPPEEWNKAEILELLTASPWVAMSSGGVRTYLASARPVIEAEKRWFRTDRKLAEGPGLSDEYVDYLRTHAGKVIVLAVEWKDWQTLADGREARIMEKSCAMRVGRRKYKLEGHFPPTPGDPFLRLVFPRAVRAEDKSVWFELYIPNSTTPHQDVEYSVKKLVNRGQPEL
ncbi:MAG: hypothetical protein ACKV22_19300 [Bryobacteraceae bacterium]